MKKSNIKGQKETQEKKKKKKGKWHVHCKGEKVLEFRLLPKILQNWFLLLSFDNNSSDGKARLKRQKSTETTKDTQDGSNFY